MLSKNDILAIRRATDLVVHLGGQYPKGLVRLIKRKALFNAKPFDQDQEHIVEGVEVRMETQRGHLALEGGGVRCFSMMGIYHGQRSSVSSILKTLKVGDEVVFSFYPDCHSNQYVRNAGLHADALWMHVTRKGQRQTWELDVSICPNNLARMCQGVPATEYATIS